MDIFLMGVMGLNMLPYYDLSDTGKHLKAMKKFFTALLTIHYFAVIPMYAIPIVYRLDIAKATTYDKPVLIIWMCGCLLWFGITLAVFILGFAITELYSWCYSYKEDE